ncbi:A/G-specific adenine glycosylase [Thioalkalivibrio sp. ALgr1]|uniref:A/G-specific adenine glycosylase n=1 Tax=Thioalkalivibrio sp. ALgr1 TaxID=748655 RepID=UPI0003789E9B|nr:A/G-specific adenine glycosylase [Thioalkalivibrio sp. ALgr1]
MTPFAERLLAWFARHGRSDLPWQHPRTPYRVWVSEIMLQQTRVETVTPYFLRFMEHFPNVESLAAADQDTVLHLWSGLGYYARARNLHRAAQHIVSEHGGDFPDTREALEQLPGIGRSTAAAIIAQAHDRPEPILDGNAKRVLARHAAVEGWPGSPSVQRELWAEAEARTPTTRCADYTQAIMDLGALLCTRTRPDCPQCPVAGDCQALAQDRTGELPAPRPRKNLPTRIRHAAHLQTVQGSLLVQRAAQGIWGGLYSLPEAAEAPELDEWVRSQWPQAEAQDTNGLRHTFSHYHLDLRIHCYRLPPNACGIMEGDRAIWYKPGTSRAVGIPAPIQRYLHEHKDSGNGTNR